MKNRNVINGAKREKTNRKTVLFVIIGAVAVGAAAAVLLYFGLIHLNGPAADAYPVAGVDVSRYQGEIDWETLSKQDIAFAYIKATEGSYYVDPRFEINFTAAAGTGLRIGAYHFFSFESSGQKQAELFCKTVEKTDGMLPPAVDVEFYGDFRSEADVDIAEIKKELRTLVDILTAEYGTRPVIYADAASYAAIVKNDFDDCDLWYRSVFTTPGDMIDWKFWQYSNRHVLKGYKGAGRYIDMNVFNGGAAEFEAYPD